MRVLLLAISGLLAAGSAYGGSQYPPQLATDTLTATELAYWDSYGPARSMYAPPQQANPSGAPTAYMNLMRQTAQTFLIPMYTSWSGLNAPTSDMGQLLLLDGPTAWSDGGPGFLLRNISSQLFTAYMSQRDSPSCIDITSPAAWLTLPTTKQVVSYLQNVITQVLFNTQLMDPTATATDPTYHADPFHTFGYLPHLPFLTDDNPQSLHYCNGYGNTFSYMILLTHYAHLLDTAFLHTARIHVMASMTAVWRCTTDAEATGSEQIGNMEYFLTEDDHDPLALFAGIPHASFLATSEAVLRARGAWGGADAATTDDFANGMWTTATALQFAYNCSHSFWLQTTQFGLFEYNSGHDENFVSEWLSALLVHAPSADVYNLLQDCHKVLWSRLAADFLPQSGQIADVSSRPQDVLNQRNEWQLWDLPLWMNSVFYPMCNSTSFGYIPGTIDSYDPILQPVGSFAPINACPPNTYTAAAPYFLSTEPHYFKFGIQNYQALHYFRQAAGYGYIPYDVLTGTTITQPNRLMQYKYGPFNGSETVNFLTNNFAMSSSNDYQYSVPNDQLTAVCRFAGPEVTSRVDTSQYTLPSSDPVEFASNDGIYMRAFVNQYQSTMLYSGLLIREPSQSNQGLYSEIRFPLTVDNLYYVLNGQRQALPTARGTSMAFPSSTMFVAQDVNASVVLRLLVADRSPNISITEVNAPTNVNTVYSSQSFPYSVTWMVDADSLEHRYGHLVISQRLLGDSNNRPLRYSHLWYAGVTRSSPELDSLVNLVSAAPVSVPTPTTTGAWTTDSTFLSSNTVTPTPTMSWSVSAKVGSKTLVVQRTEQFIPFGLDPVWQPVDPSGLHAKYLNYVQNVPIYTSLTRTVNGVDAYAWAAARKPQQTTSFSACDLHQPHLISPLPGCTTTANNDVASIATTTAAPTSTANTQCGAGLTACGGSCFDATQNNYHCCAGQLTQGPASAGCPTSAVTTGATSAPTTAAAAPTSSAGSTQCGPGLAPCGSACFNPSQNMYYCSNGQLTQCANGVCPSATPAATTAPSGNVLYSSSTVAGANGVAYSTDIVKSNGQYNFEFIPTANAGSLQYVILHYTAGSTSSNVQTSLLISTGRWSFTLPAGQASSGTAVTYSYTYNTNGAQYDTATYSTKLSM